MLVGDEQVAVAGDRDPGWRHEQAELGNDPLRAGHGIDADDSAVVKGGVVPVAAAKGTGVHNQELARPVARMPVGRRDRDGPGVDEVST